MNLHLRHKLDSDDNTLFTQCACHVFADELCSQFACQGFSLRRLADTNLTDERAQALHVYLGRNDVMLDVRGIQSELSYIQDAKDFRLKNGGPVPGFRAVMCSREELFTPIIRDSDIERGPR